jgi:hypothetical protein
MLEGIIEVADDLFERPDLSGAGEDAKGLGCRPESHVLDGL